MTKTRHKLALKTVAELARVEGFFFSACPFCNTSGFVQAEDLAFEGKGHMLIEELPIQCPKCKRFENVNMPCIVVTESAVRKLLQREMLL